MGASDNKHQLLPAQILPGIKLPGKSQGIQLSAFQGQRHHRCPSADPFEDLLPLPFQRPPDQRGALSTAQAFLGNLHHFQAYHRFQPLQILRAGFLIKLFPQIPYGNHADFQAVSPV